LRYPRGARFAISRRVAMKFGAGALVGASVASEAGRDASATAEPTGPADRLTREQYDGLAALAERIWPGAVAAGALIYIDRALAGAYARDLASYRVVLAALDARAKQQFGERFAAVKGEQQDALLRALEADALGELRAANGPALFEMLRAHVMEGVLSDPVYGGNRDFAGWKDVGYPGPYRLYTKDEQTSTQPLHMPYRSIKDL